LERAKQTPGLSQGPAALDPPRGPAENSQELAPPGLAKDFAWNSPQPVVVDWPERFAP